MEPFPPTGTALQDPNGLLAVGGDLSVERLLEAYRRVFFLGTRLTSLFFGGPLTRGPS